MNTIDDFNFNGKRALVRVDYNVPLNAEFVVTDDSRIMASLPTLNKILTDGGSLVLMSHLGRPKGEINLKYSLHHILDHVSELLKRKVLFGGDCIGNEALEMSRNLKAGEVMLLENLRFYNEEEKGDMDFSRKLSQMGDIYVNDAFGTAHRAHASTTIVANFFPGKKCAGYLMKNEVDSIEKVLKGAKKPVTAIIGGAKVSDKVLIIDKLLDIVDNLLIGGGMAYTFIRAEGGKIGKSLVEEDRIELAGQLMKKAESKQVKLLLPHDSVVADAFSNDAHIKNENSHQIGDDWMGLDIGNESAAKYAEVIAASSTILWNGPMGVFEFSNFQNGSKTVANAIAKATSKGAFSLIGGGDSVSAIHTFGLADQVSYISTGGGAMLEFLEGKELPGVKALRE